MVPSRMEVICRPMLPRIHCRSRSRHSRKAMGLVAQEDTDTALAHEQQLWSASMTACCARSPKSANADSCAPGRFEGAYVGRGLV